MRPAAKEMNSALYCDIVNNTNKPDTLYKVESGAAQLVQVHESFMKNGMMGMKHVKYVVIPAKSKITFKPGGYHIMFIKLVKDLKTNSSQKATFYFKSGRKISVKASVHTQT